MDQAALVREQVEGGEKLIRQLRASGFEVVAGIWTQLDGDSRAYLYLITPEVDNRDPRIGYGRVSDAQQALEATGLHWSERIDPFAVKLIPPRHPLAQGVIGHYARFNDPFPTWHGGSILGSVYIDGAYIYPASLFQPQPAAP